MIKSSQESVRSQVAYDQNTAQSIDRSIRQLRQQPQPYRVSLAYTFSEQDSIDSLQVDATNGVLSITLPTPNGLRRRRVIKIDSSANAVTVVGTINGVTNYSLTNQYDFVEVEPTGTAWLIISRGTLTPSFNSIAFPATQVPSSNPNTLDDYEEGTWTPTIGGNATYTTQTGTYTKIGRQVTLQFRLTINVLGTGSTTTISGLPFVSAANYAGSVGFWANLALSLVVMGFYTNSSTLILTGLTAASASSVGPLAALGNSADILGTVTYFV